MALLALLLLGLAQPEPPTASAPSSRTEVLAATLQSARETVERKLPQLQEPVQRAAAWGGLGMFYHAQDMLDEAQEAYRRALAEAPALHWHYLLAVVLGERGDINGAIVEYRRALALGGPAKTSEDQPAAPASPQQPGRMLSFYRLGLALLVQGDHQAAADALRQALDRAPDSAAVLAALGDAAAAAGDWSGAKSLLQRAAALEPGAGRVAYKLALVHRQLGNLDQARLWLAKRNGVAVPVEDPLLLEVAALSLSPKFFLDAGERAWERGEREDALAAWGNAAALAPEDEGAGLVYAHALGMLGHVDAALGEVRRVLAIDPDSARGWYLLAFLLRSSVELQEALSAARKSLQLAEDETVRALLAALCMRARCFDEAVAEYGTLAAQRSDAAYYRYWLGMARLGTGDCAAARPALALALRLQPNWGQAHLALIRADALCGDDKTRRAARVRARQLRKAKDDADTRITLAFAEASLGQSEVARGLATAAQPHPDARELLAALDAGTLPARPFADESPWWLPSELQ